MIYLTPLGRFLPVYLLDVHVYKKRTRKLWSMPSELPLSSMLRVEPGLILIIGVASCSYTIREFSFREIHLMMNSRNIQPAKILRYTVSLKPERSCPPKLVCMHVTSIPTCMNFLSRFRSIKFFDDHGENWLF